MIIAKATRSAARAEAAQELAINALGWLAGQPEPLDRFLALSGLGPHNLREAANDASFLGAVLDYLIADEPLLMAFASDQALRPQTIVESRRHLPGDDGPQ